jgi:hypothetical protein
MNNYYYFLSIKLISIVFYSVLYFIFGFITSISLNSVMSSLNEEDIKNKKNNPKYIVKVILDIIFNFALIGVSFYFIRKIVKYYIPYPLDGVAGFDKMKLKEIQGGIIIATIYMTFQTKLISKLNFIRQLIF